MAEETERRAKEGQGEISDEVFIGAYLAFVPIAQPIPTKTPAKIEPARNSGHDDIIRC